MSGSDDDNRDVQTDEETFPTAPSLLPAHVVSGQGHLLPTKLLPLEHPAMSPMHTSLPMRTDR